MLALFCNGINNKGVLAFISLSALIFPRMSWCKIIMHYVCPYKNFHCKA